MSASKKRQTMAKHQRERAVKEKRALKLERKREAAEIRIAKANGTWVPPVDEMGDDVVAEDGMAEGVAAGDVVAEGSEPDSADAPAQEEQLLA